MFKMLIIDDDKLDREILKNIFYDGFEVTSSDNPAINIEDVKNNKYDLVIVDYVMPEMNGLEFLSSLCIQNNFLFTPIIMCSGEEDETIQKKAFELGAVDYFVKPFIPANFKVRAINAINNHREQIIQSEYQISLKKGLQLLLSSQSEDNIMNQLCRGLAIAYKAEVCKLFIRVGDHFENKYEWTAEGVKPTKNSIVCGVDYQNLPVKKRVLNLENKVIYFDNIEMFKKDFPKQYNALKSLGIKSYVTVPIIADNEVTGFISIYNFDTTLKRYPEFTLGLCSGIGSYYKKKEYADLLEFDSLTGLYRKQAFQIKMTEILQNDLNQKYLIIKMDVLNFKIINTFYGLETGNELLKAIANSLKEDRKNSPLSCRLENDEFLILIKYVTPEQFSKHIEYVQKYIEKHTIIKNLRLNYGLYYIEDNMESAESIYSKAAFANRGNKKNILKPYSIYQESSLSEDIEQQKLFDDFDKGLKSGEFVSYIQPKYNIETNEYCGGEALCRWIKPDGTIIPPDKFIPVFEKTGLIYNLDKYLFECILGDIRRWLDEGYKVLPISINLSKTNFEADEDIAYKMIELVDDYHIPHSLVEIEITETMYAVNMHRVELFCHTMIQNGFKILMDDFGSGVSSLNILKDLDFSVIKLDYKFLSKTENKDKQNAIIISVIEMARRLNLPVIVEGVETIEDVEFFKSIGVKYIQGYYFGRPMQKDRFIKLIND